MKFSSLVTLIFNHFFQARRKRKSQHQGGAGQRGKKEVLAMVARGLTLRRVKKIGHASFVLSPTQKVQRTGFNARFA